MNMSTQNPITVTMDADHTLVAVFITGVPPPPAKRGFPWGGLAAILSGLGLLGTVLVKRKKKQ